MGVRQLLVVEAQGIKQRRMQVRYGNDILHRSVAYLIRLSVDVAALEASPRDPERKAVAIVVSAVRALRDGQAAELPRPEDDRGIEEPASLQVHDQRGAGLVAPRAKPLQGLGVLGVGVPRLRAQENLNKAHALLDEAPRHQAALPVLGRLRIVQAVKTPGRCRFR